MRFWDSSALVPLLVGEEKADYCLKVLVDDPEMLIWCLSREYGLHSAARVIDFGGFR